MRVIAWFVRVGLFLVMMGFALSNTETTTLRFFGIPQFEWRAPFVLFLLVFFAGGALMGVLSVVPKVLRQRREMGRLRRELAANAVARATAEVVVPPSDAARLPAVREPGVRGI
jgi:putative membrane protein